MDRHTHRDTNTQAHTHTHGQTRHRHTYRHRETHKYTLMHVDRQTCTHSHTDTQRHTQVYIHTPRTDTHIHTQIYSIHMYNTHTHTEADARCVHRHCFSTIPDGVLGTEAVLTPVKLEEAGVTQRTFPLQPPACPTASRSPLPTIPTVGPQIHSAGLPPLVPPVERTGPCRDTRPSRRRL